MTCVSGPACRDVIRRVREEVSNFRGPYHKVILVERKVNRKRSTSSGYALRIFPLRLYLDTPKGSYRVARVKAKNEFILLSLAEKLVDTFAGKFFGIQRKDTPRPWPRLHDVYGSGQCEWKTEIKARFVVSGNSETPSIYAMGKVNGKKLSTLTYPA